jgi:hypothetical protein
MFLCAYILLKFVDEVRSVSFYRQIGSSRCKYAFSLHLRETKDFIHKHIEKFYKTCEEKFKSQCAFH